MSKVQFEQGPAAATRLAYSLRRLLLDLVGINLRAPCDLLQTYSSIPPFCECERPIHEASKLSRVDVCGLPGRICGRGESGCRNR
jgi:hypothetical protein